MGSKPGGVETGGLRPRERGDAAVAGAQKRVSKVANFVRLPHADWTDRGFRILDAGETRRAWLRLRLRWSSLQHGRRSEAIGCAD